jgi:hypothetical protein
LSPTRKPTKFWFDFLAPRPNFMPKYAPKTKPNQIDFSFLVSPTP